MDPLRVYSNIIYSDNKAKKIYFYNVKLAFAKFIKEVILAKLNKHLSDMFIVFFHVLRIDKDII